MVYYCKMNAIIYSMELSLEESDLNYVGFEAFVMIPVVGSNTKKYISMEVIGISISYLHSLKRQVSRLRGSLVLMSLFLS